MTGEPEEQQTEEQAGGGRVVGGGGEFQGLAGTYTETWLITGLGEDGELRGTIELATVTHRDQ